MTSKWSAPIRAKPRRPDCRMRDGDPTSSAASIPAASATSRFDSPDLGTDLVYVVGKEFERSVIGGLDRPRPVMHATSGAGLRAMNGRRYTTGSTPLRTKQTAPSVVRVNRG